MKSNDQQEANEGNGIVDFTWMTSQHRSNELHLLKSAFERATEGRISSAFVHGSAGCGKSYLLDAFEKAVGSRAFFCRGKFDNLSTSAAEPLVSILAILEQLVHNLVESKDSPLWRERVRNALDKDFKAIEDIIPAVGHLVNNNRRRSSFAMLDAIDLDSDGYIGNE